jgi:sugar/nucleoside kinase (ribokinase family)
VLKGLDVLLINDTEARMLAGQQQPGAGGARGAGDGAAGAGGQARRVWSDGLLQQRSALRGRRGADPFRAPALPLEEVVDPTGAGDSFAGGFFGYLPRSPNSRRPPSGAPCFTAA